MTCTYYFWNWASFRVGCSPGAIHAALLSGEMPHALKTFDPQPLIAAFEEFRDKECQESEECEWQIVMDEGDVAARFAALHLTGSASLTDRMVDRILTEADGFIACYNEGSRHLVPRCKRPNQFITGQGEDRRGVGQEDVETLLLALRRSDPSAYAILICGRSFVQCLAKSAMGLRYCLEWQQGYEGPQEANGWRLWEQWRAEDGERMAALPPGVEVGSVECDNDPNIDPDLVEYEAVLKVFRAFVAGEPLPDMNWRNVTDFIWPCVAPKSAEKD